MKFDVKNSAAKSEIFIYGDIYDDSWKDDYWDNGSECYPLDIKDLFKECHGEPVDIHINSGGGDFFAGMAIANIIKAYSGETTAVIDGLAASSASLIAFGCDSIKIPENAFLMVHKPMCVAGGNSDEIRKTADLLDKLQEGMVPLYMSKAKVEESKINNMINEETWLSGKECADYFNVAVTDPLKVLNCTGNELKKWKKLPKNLISNDGNEEKLRIEKMRKEIEFELGGY